MGNVLERLFFPERAQGRIKDRERKASALSTTSKKKRGDKQTSLPPVKSKAGTMNVDPDLSAKKGKYNPSAVKTNNDEYVGVYRRRTEVSPVDVVFGGKIEDFADEDGVNKFVRWSVDAICSTGAGVKTDAIYRASGGHDVIACISTQGKESVQEVLKKQKNVHDLTGALKLFFRSLKEPILRMEDFQSVEKDASKAKPIEERLREVIDCKLSKEEKATLSFLMRHLLSVLTHAENKMSLEGMGVVFGPTLMRCGDDVIDMHAEMKQMNTIVELLLQHCDVIFQQPNTSQPGDTAAS